MFISVKEAMELTGMSSTTIYRLCNKRINTLYVRKEDNKFLIDKEFILATFPPDIVAMDQDFETEKNTIIQPEIEKIQIEKSDKLEPMFIIESEDESNLDLEIIKSVKVFENGNSTQISKETETAELIGKSEIKNFDGIEEKLQLIASSQNFNIQEKTISVQPETTDTPETKKTKKFNWEALIGISASLLVVGLLIYLVYLDVH